MRSIACAWIVCLVGVIALGDSWDPAAPDYSGRAGETLYVSKLGDNSDGRSWATAFTTIQAALDRVPDAEGGHRIIVRPDTYMEANLTVPHPGAKGSYNLLIGDTDGALGSGKAGRVVVDSGDADKGFKSYDWWGTIRATTQGWSEEHKDPTFSAIVWDRWILRNLYATGGDAGFFWDCTNRIEPFSIVVENCVSIGRAFGLGVASCLSRPDEPITFRRCKAWSLDWWGDTAGMYIRVENEAMPERPDVVIEDCTMVSPQCALKGGNYGFHTFMRIQVERSELIALNFSQPAGTPTDGIIQSVQNGKYLHVDLVDSTLMGYKVFGVKVDQDTAGDIGYSTKGAVNAYVQFTQDVPEGMLRLGHWPVEVFDAIAMPAPEADAVLYDEQIVQKDMCEVTPFVWKGRACLLACVRPGSGGTAEDHYLTIRDAESNEELSRFGVGYSLASAFVNDDVVYVSAARFADANWNDVTVFRSEDLKTWTASVAIQQDDGEHLFNSSICEGPDGFVLAYESNDPTYPAFTIKFATSPDLKTWTKLPEAVFGTDRYTACPTVRFHDGFYYVFYLERKAPRWFFETYVVRSPDLQTWYQSPMNPVVSPTGIADSINASDPDFAEIEGKTYFYYAVGDQRTWMDVKRVTFNGTEDEFLRHWFPNDGVRDTGDLAGYRLRQAESARAARQAWFRDAKFGLFIHWGPFAVQGADADAAYDYFDLKADASLRGDYTRYGYAFDPKKFDAAKWVAAAQMAGMNYVVLTSKHHDGYCLFDTAYTEYDSVDQQPKTDYVRALADAAKAAGMKMGLYYSMLDWHHPQYGADLDGYVDNVLFGQVRELCTNYSDLACVWFDGEWDHPAATWKADELVSMINALQPSALVNDRLGVGERGVSRICDFYTREQPSEIDVPMGFEGRKAMPWEACMTMGNYWQYSILDVEPSSAEDLLRRLADVVSRGGNLLLNVGPTPDGEIPPAALDRLQAMGAWLAVNGEAIYGCEPSPFPRSAGLTCTWKGNRLYVIGCEAKQVVLPGLQNTILSAAVLGGETLNFDNEAKTIIVPEGFAARTLPVIAVELDAKPVVQQ